MFNLGCENELTFTLNRLIERALKTEVDPIL